MSIIKKISLILPILFVASMSQLNAEEVKKIGKYKDWESMVVTEASGKVCFAQSSPILQAAKSNKRDAKLFIAFRPAEQIINEVNPKYPFGLSLSNTIIEGALHQRYLNEHFPTITDCKESNTPREFFNHLVKKAISENGK